MQYRTYQSITGTILYVFFVIFESLDSSSRTNERTYFRYYSLEVLSLQALYSACKYNK